MGGLLVGGGGGGAKGMLAPSQIIGGPAIVPQSTDIRHSVMCKVYTGYHGTSEI